MEKKELIRNRKRFRNWLYESAVSRTVRGFLPAFLEGDSRVYRLQVDDSMSPRTDGTTIVISLPPFVLRDDMDFGDWLVLLRAVTAHEAEHLNSSCFRDIHAIRRWYGKRLEKNYGISYEIGANIGQNVLNIAEDGRIEAISVRRRPGMAVPFQWMNRLLREDTEIRARATDGLQESADFFGMLLSYAKTGLEAPGADCYRDTPLQEAFEAGKPFLDRAVSEETSNGCKKQVQKLLKAAEPYLAGLLLSSEALRDSLNRKTAPEYTANGEAKAGTEPPSGTSGRQENPLRAKGAVSSNAMRRNEEKPEAMRQSDTVTETDGMQEKLDRLKEMLSGQLNEADRRKQAEMPVYEGLNDAELAEINAFFPKDREELEVLVLPVLENEPLPEELQRSALFLRREVRNILEKRRRAGKNLRRGILDPAALWKSGFSEELFYRKRNPEKGSCVFYILIDNSGSMASYTEREGLQKYQAARCAAAVVEEALRGLLACKIALFYDTDKVYHQIVRSFSEKSRKNFSWNSLKELGPGGSNADAVHIRIAGKELAKRREAKKVLLVLSDGVPSSYSSELSATVEVRTAVRDVRKSGVTVIPLMFGDQEFIRSNKSRYEALYEKDVYACTPEEINQKLADLFRALIAN